MAADSIRSPRHGQSADLETSLAQLDTLDRFELQSRFMGLYGRPSPANTSRQLLVLAISYRLQEQVHGALRPAIRKKLVEGDFRRPVQTGNGTVLVREWQGRHHTVTVLSSGVEYQGTTYRSLSEVARVISGVKRSGPAFFGLKEPRDGRR